MSSPLYCQLHVGNNEPSYLGIILEFASWPELISKPGFAFVKARKPVVWMFLEQRSRYAAFIEFYTQIHHYRPPELLISFGHRPCALHSYIFAFLHRRTTSLAQNFFCHSLADFRYIRHFISDADQRGRPSIALYREVRADL